MEKTELTMAIKKTTTKKSRTNSMSIGTWIPKEEYELLKLLLDLRGITTSQFLREYTYKELDKNRENLEVVKKAIDDIKAQSNIVVGIPKIA